jgi:hypothetical protein
VVSLVALATRVTLAALRALLALRAGRSETLAPRRTADVPADLLEALVAVVELDVAERRPSTARLDTGEDDAAALVSTATNAITKIFFILSPLTDCRGRSLPSAVSLVAQCSVCALVETVDN